MKEVTISQQLREEGRENEASKRNLPYSARDLAVIVSKNLSPVQRVVPTTPDIRSTLDAYLPAGTVLSDSSITRLQKLAEETVDEDDAETVKLLPTFTRMLQDPGQTPAIDYAGAAEMVDVALRVEAFRREQMGVP